MMNEIPNCDPKYQEPESFIVGKYEPLAAEIEQELRGYRIEQKYCE